MTDTLRAIRDTYNNLDIFGEASELDAAKFVDEMSGDGDETPAEDQNVPDSLPLPAALTLVDASHGDGIQFLTGIAEQKLAQFMAKSKDMRATADSRALFSNMAMGIEQLLVEWGARVAEAEERVAASTPDERRLLGVDVTKILEAEPRSTSSVVGPPPAGVQRNTRAAQEFFKKSDATRD